MAKVSVVQRNEKRKILVARHAKRRAELKVIMEDQTKSYEERLGAFFKLDKLPRDSAKCRVKNRCAITGRPKGYCRQFGVSRVKLRELVAFGMVPGVVKSSW